MLLCRAGYDNKMTIKRGKKKQKKGVRKFSNKMHFGVIFSSYYMLLVHMDVFYVVSYMQNEQVLVKIPGTKE